MQHYRTKYPILLYFLAFIGVLLIIAGVALVVYSPKPQVEHVEKTLPASQVMPASNAQPAP